MDYDVVIIGGGPSGLATAIKLAQTFKEKNLDKSICVLEKSAEIGGHILSGNVFETTALDELIPDWKEKGAPLDVKVKRDAIKGRINETWFKVEKEGIYYGQCSELCGIKHAFMPITVKVVSEEEYQKWLSEARVKFAKEEIENDKLKLASK
mgnify:CR=1 FL=1